MKLADIVAEYVSVRAPGWLVLSGQEALASALRATQFYAGYGGIESMALPTAPSSAIKQLTSITPEVVLTVSEWALISPLFVLYLEFENAQRLEASRASGLEVYGRSTSEVAQDIKEAEERMPQKAFSQPMLILGVNGGDELPPLLGYPIQPYYYWLLQYP